MKCTACGHEKVIVNYKAPIGGWYTDPLTGKTVPRVRCARCEKPIVNNAHGDDREKYQEHA